MPSTNTTRRPKANPPKPKLLSRAECTTLYQTLAQLHPTPQTELVYQTTFELLVAVVLSAQTTDRAVNQVTARLFAQANTPARILMLGEAGLIECIKSLGLFRSKARHLIALCQLLLEHHQGQVPQALQALEALPGVGRKTARVVMNVAFGQPYIAVDTHVFRVANRTGLADGKRVLDVEHQLEQRTPARFKHHAHHWLILHGRHLCKARRPECWRCPIATVCHYPEKEGLVSDHPLQPAISIST